MSDDFRLESERVVAPVPHLAVMRDPRLPPPTPQELRDALSGLSAPEVMLIAHHSLADPPRLQACFEAMAELWPGFFASAIDFEFKVRRVQRETAVPRAKLALVPCNKSKLEESATYLAATIGASGLVCEIVKATATGRARARAHQLLFRLEPIR